MAERDRPTSYREAVDLARVLTDGLENFEAYLALARKCVTAQLAFELNVLDLGKANTMHIDQLIEAEAYSMAQPAHLRDASVYDVDQPPAELVKMLDTLGEIKPVES